MKKCVLILLAFLLTGSIALFGVSCTFSRAVEPGMAAEGAKVSDAQIRDSSALIRERITHFSEIYGFDPEAVSGAVDEETVRAMSEKASRWWSSILLYGAADDAPQFDPKALEEAILADGKFLETHSGEDAELTAAEASSAIAKSIERIILPMRQVVIRKGLTEAGLRVDLPNLVLFLTGLPWAALALCALLAGLIALLESRKLRQSLLYIGSSFGGAALVLIAASVLAGASGVRALIREASASLAVQYGAVANGMILRLAVFAVLLLAGCAVCLVFCRRDGKKA